MKGHLKEAERLFNEQDKNLIGILTDVKNAIQSGDSIFKQDERWKAELAKGLSHASKAEQLNTKVDEGFKGVERWISERKLPELMQERHDKAYGQYQERYSQFENLLTPLQRAKDEGDQIDAR